MYMCNNGNETIEEYALRRNKMGYYFCTLHKHNHRVDSKIGVKCIGNDILYKVVEHKEEKANTEDVWDKRFAKNQKNGKKLSMPKAKKSETKAIITTLESDDYYKRFKASQKIWNSRKF